MTDSETFLAPWPRVLVEMKDYVDLCFIARGRQLATITVFISRALVPQAQVQPHMREFRAALARLPNCRIELKATGQVAHKIEIGYRR